MPAVFAFLSSMRRSEVVSKLSHWRKPSSGSLHLLWILLLLLTFGFLSTTKVLAAGPVLPHDVPLPAWALGVTPTDSGSVGAGPSSADLVYLASGLYENHPGVDLGARNPVGPSPIFARAYNVKNAYLAHGSPGLPAGWTHNYDVTVQSGATTRANVTLKYPNGATEIWTPGAISGSNVSLTPPPGTPYLVSGVLASAPAVGWKSLTMTFKDESRWTFTPVTTSSIPPDGALSASHPFTPLSIGVPTSSAFLLTQISSVIGRSILLNYDASSRLVSITDDANLINSAVPATTLLTFTYTGFHSTLNNVTEYSDPARPRQILYTSSSFADGTTFLYTVSHVSAAGAQNPPTLWQYAYTQMFGQPFLTQVGILDPTGVTGGVLKNTLTYDTLGRVQQIADANGNLRAYTYGVGTQVQVSNNGVVAASWTQNFDASNRNTGTVDALGHQETTLYEDAGNLYRPTRLTNRNGQTVVFSYDPVYGNLLSADTPTNGARLMTQYQYDSSRFAAGVLTTTQTGNLTPSGTKQYATALSVVVDGASIPQPIGLPSQTTSPQPGVAGATIATSYVYTSLGNILQLTVPGPNGPVTYKYNYTSDPAYNYARAEALGEPVTITDPMGHVTHYRYDGRGNLTTVADPLGRQTDYQYNDADQVTQILAPLKAANSPGRVHVVYTYLYVGGPLIRQDLYDENNVLGRTAQYAKGKEGEHKAQTGSVEAATLAYDPAYRLKTLTDGSSHAFSHQYDLKGNLTQFAHPRANTGYVGYDTVQGVYDNDDNLTQTTDGNNKTIQYSLAADDSRLTDVLYPLNTLLATHTDYDAYGRPTHTGDNSGDHLLTYDDANNVLSATTIYRGLPAQTISYTYNPDGSRASMTTPSGTTAYSYNDDGLLTAVTFPWNQTLFYTYDAAHRLLTEQQTKFTTTYQYDGLNELLDLNVVAGNAAHSLLAHFDTMTYDGAGNRLSLRATVYRGARITGPASVVSYWRTWTYDSRDELTNEFVGWSGAIGGGNFQADAADNLTMIRSQGKAVNADNQSTDLSQNYDGNGSPADFYNGGLLTNFFQYDVNNHLTSVTWNSGNVTSTYRSDGLRARKQINVGSSPGSPTYFLYDGTRVVCELDGGGSVTASYGYGAAGLAQRVPSPFAAGYTAYVYDPMGNVTLRMRQNELNAALNQLDPTQPYDLSGYDAFGKRMLYQYNVQPTQFNPPDPVGYGGQLGNYTDVEANLVLMTYRFYSPVYCRFLTRDPKGYKGGINLYAYCRNNPINRFDPLGLDEDGFFSWHTLGDVLAGAGGGIITGGNPLGVAAGVALFEGLYSGAQGHSATQAVTHGLISGGMTYGTGWALGALGKTPLARNLAGRLSSGVSNALGRTFGSSCFVAGTPIAMADGTSKPIEQVAIGDKVMTRDPKTGQTAAKPVTQISAHATEQTLVLSFANGQTIETTAGHPFYVEGKGFVLAGRLALGNAIVTRAGPATRLTGIQNKTHRVVVYNFAVADFHTYFVGNFNGGLWVHNDCTEVVDVLNQVLRQKAGFSGAGQPIILDSNLAGSGVADALRAAGRNVRSVPEIFSGSDPGDPAIRQLAEQIGARVLSADRGRQIGQGFGRLAIPARGGTRQVSTLIRLLEEHGL